MSNATLTLKVTPRRMLQPREAADYCGIPTKRFVVECTVSPVAMPHGAKLYDMQDLDTWIDSLKTGQACSDDDLIRQLG